MKNSRHVPPKTLSLLRQHLILESLPLPLVNPDPLPPPNDVAHNSRAQPILCNLAHRVRIHRLFQGNQLIVIPMRSMSHHGLRSKIMTAPCILQILEAALRHVRTTSPLSVGTGIHGIHVIRRDGRGARGDAVEQSVEEDGRDGQVDVFAEQDVLLGALDAVPGEGREPVFGPAGPVAAVVQLHGGAGRAAFWAGEVDGWGGVVFEGGAVDEGFGFVAFAIEEEGAEGVLDEGWGTHGGGGGGRIVVIFSVSGTGLRLMHPQKSPHRHFIAYLVKRSREEQF